jgi:hypothetical protein
MSQTASNAAFSANSIVVKYGEHDSNLSEQPPQSDVSASSLNRLIGHVPSLSRVTSTRTNRNRAATFFTASGIIDKGPLQSDSLMSGDEKILLLPKSPIVGSVFHGDTAIAHIPQGTLFACGADGSVSAFSSPEGKMQSKYESSSEQPTARELQFPTSDGKITRIPVEGLSEWAFDKNYNKPYVMATIAGDSTAASKAK